MTKTVLESVSEDDEVLQEMIRQDEFKETFVVRKKDIPVPEDGRIVISPRIKVNELQIIFEEAVDDTVTEYQIKVEIFACFEPVGEFIIYLFLESCILQYFCEI